MREPAKPVPTAASVVGRQLDAYNARDIEAFMDCWHEDAEVFVHPATPLAMGAGEIRTRHVARFAEPDLYANLIARFSVESMVVDREVVTRNFPEGLRLVDVVAIYEVTDSKIAKAWFRLGEPRQPHAPHSCLLDFPFDLA